MDEFEELALREREARRIARRQWFWLHFAVYATTQVPVGVLADRFGYRRLLVAGEIGRASCRERV